jgi:hypothetical protein
MKVTQWFAPGIKPVRVGVYERKHKHLLFTLFAYWDGYSWFLGRETPELAHKETTFSANQKGFFWRGLDEQPNAD